MPSYVVRSGDSLFLIARRFGTTPEALATANGLSEPERIAPGVTLQVPGYTTKSTFEAAPGERYTVQPGDSLFLIGRRNGLTVQELAAANGLSPSEPLLPGQTLWIPAPKGGTNAPQGSRYVVQAGDSLFLIGQRHGVSAEAIAAANGISTQAQLQIGQVLTIPSAQSGSEAPGRRHVVQAGDSLFLIGKRYGLSAEAIAAANGISTRDQLQIGQVLTIPNATQPPSTGTGPVTTPPPVTAPAEGDTSFRALWPVIQHHAAKYGADPKVVAGIIAQESTWVNHKVHRDGTGHGLIGLDDNGMLPAFEKWSNFKVGRGRNARIIPPALQVEFLAKTIGEMTKNHRGNTWAAVREWHRGLGPGMWDSRGNKYEQLIRGHIKTLF